MSLTEDLERDVMAYIRGYFIDIFADFDLYKPVYETMIQSTMIEPSTDTLLCYILGQVMGMVSFQLELAGLSVDEKADITESLYQEIQFSIIKLRGDLERRQFL